MRHSGGIDLHAAADEKSGGPRQSLRWSRTFARLHHKKEAPADDRRTQKQKEALIMDKVQRMKQQKQYEDYVKKKKENAPAQCMAQHAQGISPGRDNLLSRTGDLPLL